MGFISFCCASNRLADSFLSLRDSWAPDIFVLPRIARLWLFGGESMQLSSITASAAQPIQQAELILKLYELRREGVMRQARGFIGGELLPSSAHDLVAQVSAGDQKSGFILQVYGYWDMVSAFVIHGALSEPGLRHMSGNVFPVFENPALPRWFPREDEPAGMDAKPAIRRGVLGAEPRAC